MVITDEAEEQRGEIQLGVERYKLLGGKRMPEEAVPSTCWRVASAGLPPANVSLMSSRPSPLQGWLALQSNLTATFDADDPWMSVYVTSELWSRLIRTQKRICRKPKTLCC